MSPQGCILSSLPYILYTNDCRRQCIDRYILKFTDDTVIVSLLQGEDDAPGQVGDDFIIWCEKSYLKLNVSKTKDVHRF